MRRVMLLVTAIGVALLLASGVALAAPVGMLKQYKVPTAGSSPEHITQTSDGNFWFTESFVNDQNVQGHNVGRITPSGRVTEFNVCDFCFPTDIDVPLWGLLIPIRRTFEQYINLRPVKLFDGIRSPLAYVGPQDIDFVMVREYNEEEYSEIDGRLYRNSRHEIAVRESVFTRRGVRRTIEFVLSWPKAARAA
jgi:Isocitrate/isopropylmalate dehydrogenase